MKISNALLLLASATATTATTIRSANAKSALLSKSRRVEEAGDDANAAADMSFLSNYKLKLIGCANGEKYVNQENGETEYGSVIFRLCPADECDSDSATGCKNGYGDYVVGLNTFVENWLEDKREDMQQDDAFKVEEFGECREYQVDNDDGKNQAVYYVGPTCSDSTIKLGFFSEYTCTTVPEDVTFEDISNGWTLPYSSGGLVTGACEGCAGYNDNGEFEVSEMCTTLWETSGRCEAKMENTGYYGADSSSCEFIESLMPVSKSGAGAAVGWAIFALIVVGVGAYGYTKWWTSKKQGSSMASGGVLN